MPPLPERRALLRAAVAGAALLGGAGRHARAAFGQPPRSLTVAAWDGPYAAALKQLVDDGPMKAAGIAIRQELDTETMRLAALGRPVPPDVVLLSDLEAYQLSLRQAFRPVTTEGVARLPQVAPGLRTPYGIPQGQTGVVVVSHAAMEGRRPDSFATLFAAAAQGRAGFSSDLAIYNIAAATLARGRPLNDLEPGRLALAELKKAGKLRVYPDNEALGQAVATGEVEAGLMWRSRAYAWERAGRPVRNLVPVEGAIAFMVMGCVPVAAAEPGDAMQYLNALLSPEVQARMAEQAGLSPTISNVRLPDEVWRAMGFTTVQRRALHVLGLSLMTRIGPQLRTFWDKELL